MRTIFSIRFLAAIGAVIGLFFLVSAVVAGRQTIADREPESPRQRTIDLVAPIVGAELDGFGIVDGVATGRAVFDLGDDRLVGVAPGTYGRIECLPTTEECVVVAELLGDAVIWFALVDAGPAGTVVMPAIDVLDRDEAVLVNGWRVPYATVLDRRCDREFASYREFRDEIGTAFTSIYSLEDGELFAVVCD